MKRQSYIVTEDSVPPAATDRTRCFWCNAKINTEHEATCPRRVRSVVLTFQVEVVATIPEHWDEIHTIFHYNMGTWCAQNLIEQMEEQSKENGCICELTELLSIREATAEDEDRAQIHVHKKSS